MIACSLLVGYFGIKEMEHVGSLTQRLYRHPLTVGYTIRDVHIHLFELHELVTGWPRNLAGQARRRRALPGQARGRGRDHLAREGGASGGRERNEIPMAS
jgi:hypothetical protein